MLQHTFIEPAIYLDSVLLVSPELQILTIMSRSALGPIYS